MIWIPVLWTLAALGTLAAVRVTDEDEDCKLDARERGELEALFALDDRVALELLGEGRPRADVYAAMLRGAAELETRGCPSYARRVREKANRILVLPDAPPTPPAFDPMPPAMPPPGTPPAMPPPAPAPLPPRTWPSPATILGLTGAQSAALFREMMGSLARDFRSVDPESLDALGRRLSALGYTNFGDQAITWAGCVRIALRDPAYVPTTCGPYRYSRINPGVPQRDAMGQAPRRKQLVRLTPHVGGWAVVSPDQRYGSNRPAVMWEPSALNRAGAAARTFIPPGAYVRTGETVFAFVQVPNIGAGRYTRASYLARNGVYHNGWILTRDLRRSLAPST